MVAIVGAVLFALALIFHITGTSLAVIDATFLMLAGLICVALHLAGIGTRRPVRARRY
jgi:hypothetical protein